MFLFECISTKTMHEDEREFRARLVYAYFAFALKPSSPSLSVVTGLGTRVPKSVQDWSQCGLCQRHPTLPLSFLAVVVKKSVSLQYRPHTHSQWPLAQSLAPQCGLQLHVLRYRPAAAPRSPPRSDNHTMLVRLPRPRNVSSVSLCPPLTRCLRCTLEASPRRIKQILTIQTVAVKKFTEDHEWIELDSDGKIGTCALEHTTTPHSPQA